MKQFALSCETHNRLKNSILHPFISLYVEYLEREQYSDYSISSNIRSVGHFAHWITNERIPLDKINCSVQAKFLTEHLPVCNCSCPAPRLKHVNPALTIFFKLLRSEGIIVPIEERDECSRELAAFDTYMRDVAGFAKNTRVQRLSVIKRFLYEHFDKTKIVITDLDALTIRRFIFGEQNRSPRTINDTGVAIRRYLSFRAISGDQVTPLLTAIPRISSLQLQVLPKILSPVQIDELLASFNQDVRLYRRAYAMVRCMTDLGLRCGEVATLHLDDINWLEGTLCITKSKARRADILPLPVATGKAISEYLQHERPEVRHRFIFARHKAPHHLPITVDIVKNTIIAAFHRCGWERADPYVLRRTVASRLLNDGAPMKHIMDVMRHRDADTSMIYTKIDLKRLAAVAMPWPGSVA